MPISSTTFIHIVCLILGSVLFALGYLEQFQLLWEAFFLLWLGGYSLLRTMVQRWSEHRWYRWFQRILGVISLSCIVGALYLSTWPDVSSLSTSWQYGVLSIWSVFLFLCARFAQDEVIRTRVYFLSWFPLLYLVGLVVPNIQVYTNGTAWILGCMVLFEGALRGLWSLYRPLEILPSTIPYFFFHRFDPIRSIFSALQERLGIDLQGAQAFAFARKAMLPLTAFLLIFLWLLSSFVLILPHETGLRYQFGVPDVDTLSPGMHIKWPWPWGEIRRAPSARILSMKIGHEEEEGEEEEEESILWANQHAEEEFSLLMGDQVNLIAVDGTLQYQISDARQYLLSWQNPEAQLEGIAYQVLSRYCAQRTLSDALSENLQVLADDVLKQVQQQASDLELGLMPISFTFSALHPPVSVARDYQSVVSAQIDQQSTIIRAEAYRIKSMPRATIEAREQRVDAQKEAMERISKAKGEAQAFRGLYETVNRDRSLYLFQRRLDVLKKNLKGRRMTIIDHELEKEGATLWIED